MSGVRRRCGSDSGGRWPPRRRLRGVLVELDQAAAGPLGRHGRFWTSIRSLQEAEYVAAESPTCGTAPPAALADVRGTIFISAAIVLSGLGIAEAAGQAQPVQQVQPAQQAEPAQPNIKPAAPVKPVAPVTPVPPRQPKAVAASTPDARRPCLRKRNQASNRFASDLAILAMSPTQADVERARRHKSKRR